MKRQGGFTLIEMIVVIVILGILAVTAAPKFLNFQDDARTAALNGLKGAMDSAASMIHGQALIKGATKTGTDNTVTMAGNYPAASEAGIGAAMVLNTNDWVGKDGTNRVEYKLKSDSDGDKCAIYIWDVEGSADAPTTSVDTCTLEFGS